jgi:hypothetical protein
MNMIDGCIDPDIIHAPSLSDLQGGDTFLYQGKRFEYLYLSKEGWHFTKELSYPFDVSVWTYDAEVDWLEN